MELLFIVDPLDTFKTAKDTTYAMMRAAIARGHALWTCRVDELVFDSMTGDTRVGRVLATCRRLAIQPQASPWFVEEAPQERELRAFDAVLMRKDPPFDMEYVYATYLLERAEADGARVFNSGRAIRDHNEKLAIAGFPHLTAPTLVTRSAVRLREFVRKHDRAIFKLLDGMGGASIFQARADDPNLSVIIETLNQFGARSVMAQRFLPEIVDGDKRILLINGEVVPHALARIPAQGEVRGNMAAGGRPRAQPLSDSDWRIARELAPVLAARGLFLVGLDVIGSSVTEINVTSPTGFQEIAAQTGFDVASMFVEALESEVGAR